MCQNISQNPEKITRNTMKRTSRTARSMPARTSTIVFVGGRSAGRAGSRKKRNVAAHSRAETQEATTRT
jgi:hypothetical protein